MNGAVAVITVKWAGQRFDAVEIDRREPVSVLKGQLYSLTGVPPERQKILLKGTILKDSADLQALDIPSGSVLTLMGNADVLSRPAKETRFMEDMTETERNVAQNIPPGLVNTGNTCYFNATLQCLLSMPEFSATLESQPGTALFSSQEPSNVLLSLRDLVKLLRSSGEAINPVIFLSVLRKIYPQFAQADNEGAFMQQDAEECWSLLVNNLRDHAKEGLSEAKMAGEFLTKVVCDDSPSDVSFASEHFVKLSCHISQDINTLEAGLERGLVEHFDKFSESLGRNARYTKTLRISSLPRYLTVNFIRFFWKQSERTKAKILKKVVFPIELDVFTLCSDDLRQDLLKVRDAKDDSCAGKPTGRYQLNAVLTHIGRSADAGHYIAWVRDPKSPDKWWKFDDDKVSAVTTEDIKALCGGGDWHIAYLCLYQALQR